MFSFAIWQWLWEWSSEKQNKKQFSMWINHMAVPKVQNETCENRFEFAVPTHLSLIPYFGFITTSSPAGLQQLILKLQCVLFDAIQFRK